jgi:DNA modification methylase
LHTNNKFSIFNNDALEVLRVMPSDSIEALVTDPPSGIGFRRFDWDNDKGGRDEWVSWLSEIMIECHRVLKPGAFGFVWALPRHSHWTAVGIENAGFKIKDIITHVYGSGFPKNLNISKAITKSKFVDMDLVYKVTSWIRNRRNELGLTNQELDEIARIKGGACHWTANTPKAQPTIPTLERWKLLEPVLGPAPEWMKPLLLPAYSEGRREESDSTQWQGLGTALKPASEHWILIQKKIVAPNVASNILKFKTGALNIDEARIPAKDEIPKARFLNFQGGSFLWDAKGARKNGYTPHPNGRHPTNFLLTKGHDEESCPVRLLDNESTRAKKVSSYFKTFAPEKPFVYIKKVSTSERGEDNDHPTVKPLNLMRYLIDLIVPVGGTVLDPFMGSGSTGVAALLGGFEFVGVEKDRHYFEIAEKRVQGAIKNNNGGKNE